jgi:hypothetical protein
MAGPGHSCWWSVPPRIFVHWLIARTTRRDGYGDPAGQGPQEHLGAKCDWRPCARNRSHGHVSRAECSTQLGRVPRRRAGLAGVVAPTGDLAPPVPPTGGSAWLAPATPVGGLFRRGYSCTGSSHALLAATGTAILLGFCESSCSGVHQQSESASIQRENSGSTSASRCGIAANSMRTGAGSDLPPRVEREVRDTSLWCRSSRARAAIARPGLHRHGGPAFLSTSSSLNAKIAA